MATLVKSFGISGIDAYVVDIETKTLGGQPMISVIGLGDQSVKEAAERIQSAIDECGYEFPKKRVIISLAPSDQKKAGSHYDLAMAIGVLQQEHEIGARNLGEYGIIGELTLNGGIRACKGILPMAVAAKRAGIKKLIVPDANVPEAELVHGIQVIGFSSMSDVIRFLEGRLQYNQMEKSIREGQKSEPAGMKKIDFSDVVGQEGLLDAVVLAAAGGHNMLMIGEPGCGKTMIAQRIPTILPKMNEEECLEVTKIYSISGLLPDRHGLIQNRPFRAPHHNASLNALIGGGANAMPGEVSLAHNGVLFLDEMAEFPRNILDSLRQPIEDKQVSIARVSGMHTFPANFMLVAAMNPSPCGYYPNQRCRCTDYEIIKYRNKISGPIMDRIDIQKSVSPVDYFHMPADRHGKTSEELRAIVESAREVQQIRYADVEGVNSNAQMSTAQLKEYCVLDEVCRKALQEICEKYNYSTRVIHKLLRLARTSADIDHADKIRLSDIHKVISMRELDQSHSQMLVVEGVSHEKKRKK